MCGPLRPGKKSQSQSRMHAEVGIICRLDNAHSWLKIPSSIRDWPAPKVRRVFSRYPRQLWKTKQQIKHNLQQQQQ